jgi:hypothetical protein
VFAMSRIGMSRGCGYVTLTNRNTRESARVEEADLPQWFFRKVNEHRGGDWQPPAVPDHRPPALPQHVLGGRCLECGSGDDFDEVSELCARCLSAEPWGTEMEAVWF